MPDAHDAATVHPLLLDRYRAEGTRGAGGLGMVVKPLDTRLQRLVAITLLTESPAASHADTIRALGERLAREAEAGARMGVPPNVATVHDLADAVGTSSPAAPAHRPFGGRSPKGAA